MIKLLGLLPLILLSSCSSIFMISDRKPVLLRPTTIKHLKVRPGEVIIFEAIGSNKDEVICNDKKVPSYFYNGKNRIIFSETYFSKFKDINCKYLVDNHALANIKVVLKKFPTERLRVDKKRVFPNKKDSARVKKEQLFLNSNYNSSPSEPLFNSAFDFPITSKVTSIYGSRRIFNKKKQTQHLGTDYRAARGTPIYAANAGKVVVSRDLFYTGYTVTIDHGLSIFTIYGHLSKLFVKEGEYVPKGKVIGLSGSTGRSTGPHLHWGVKVDGNFIEGSSLVKATKFLNSSKQK